jgi:hypothetical protein
VKVAKNQQPYVKFVLAIEQKISNPVRAILPIRMGGRDMTGRIILVGTLRFWPLISLIRRE